jgi:predicted enzyme related to lactoylglutathione lyase
MGNSGGRFVWYELATTDVEKAKAFYARVMGWGTAEASMPGSGYSLFTAKDNPVAGLMQLPVGVLGRGSAPQWIGYVAVDDVDAAALRARQLGGTVQVPPRDVLNVSRFSVIADPQRATLALIKGRGGEIKPPAPPGTPGHAGWHELLARDMEGAFAFYSALLGWQKTDNQDSPASTYLQFCLGTELVGGMFMQPDTPVLPTWIYYFNVTGIEAAAKRAVAAGGQILQGPVAVPGGAWIVQAQDPQGAIFALIDRRVRVTVGCYRARPSQDKPGGAG